MKSMSDFKIAAPKKVTIDDFGFDVYIRKPSYKVVSDANKTWDSAQRNLVYVKGCVTNEHGQPLYDDITTDELANEFPWQIILEVAKVIYENFKETDNSEEEMLKK